MMGIDKATGQDRQARLYELTSQASLPTMFHNEERPRNVWTEQLALVEQIGAPDSPKLIPDDYALRSEVYGLSAIILAEDGLVWNMRIINDGPLGRKYGYSEEASAAAPGKVGAVLKLLDERLAAQGLGARFGWGCGFGCRYLLGHHEHGCFAPHLRRSCP